MRVVENMYSLEILNKELKRLNDEKKAINGHYFRDSFGDFYADKCLSTLEENISDLEFHIDFIS